MQDETKAGSELKATVRLGTITDIQRRFYLSYGQAKEIHDAIQGAAIEAARVERERCIDRAFGWWAGTEFLETIPTDVACKSIRAALEA